MSKMAELDASIQALGGSIDNLRCERDHFKDQASRAHADNVRLRYLLTDLRDALADRYDGAPDSPTLWMGELIDRAGKLLAR